MITVVAVGKKHEEWVREGVERYEKRLKAPFDVQWVLLQHSSLEGAAARKEESERIRSRVSDHDHVILLDETGKSYDSPSLSVYFETLFTGSKNVVVIIGGAYGVDDELIDRSDAVLSLSKMVFPHQLVRLILIEQIYRAQAISRGQKYHHQ